MVRIRRAKMEDVVSIARVHTRSFLAAHQGLIPPAALAKVDESKVLERWRVRFQGNAFSTYLAEADQKIIGLICFFFSEDRGKNTAEILYLYIDPDYWRQGIGQRLMLTGLKTLYAAGIRKVSVWVLKNNPNARAFYESLGAKLAGIERLHETLGTHLEQIKYSVSLDELFLLRNKG